LAGPLSRTERTAGLAGPAGPRSTSPPLALSPWSPLWSTAFDPLVALLVDPPWPFWSIAWLTAWSTACRSILSCLACLPCLPCLPCLSCLSCPACPLPSPPLALWSTYRQVDRLPASRSTARPLAARPTDLPPDRPTDPFSLPPLSLPFDRPTLPVDPTGRPTGRPTARSTARPTGRPTASIADPFPPCKILPTWESNFAQPCKPLPTRHN
jgi:hypothetical protein